MELVRMIQSDTKLMGKKGVTGSNSKSAFQKLLLRLPIPKMEFAP